MQTEPSTFVTALTQDYDVQIRVTQKRMKNMKNMFDDVCTERVSRVLAIPTRDPGAETRQQADARGKQMGIHESVEFTAI